MRNISFFIALLFLALLAPPVSAKADSSASLKQTAQSLYNKMNGAADHLNVDGVISFFDPDYISYSDKDKVDLQTFREQLQVLFSNATKMHVSTIVKSVMKVENDMVVVCSTHMALVLHDHQSGKSVTLVQDETDRDYWVKISGAWKMHQEHVLSMHATQNGKPIQ